MESQIYKDLDRLLGQDSSHQTNEALAAATESNQTTSHGEDTQGESARPPPVPSGPNSGSSKLSLPLANNIDENEEQDEWAYVSSQLRRLLFSFSVCVCDDHHL